MRSRIRTYVDSRAEALKRARDKVRYDPTKGDLFWLDTGARIQTRLDAKGYATFCFLGQHVYVHRLVFAVMTGSVPEQVDHANGIKSDNRWANLRAATASQNIANRPALKSSSHGVKGAYFDKRLKGDRRWRAQIVKDGTRYRLGRFATAEEAGEAYRQAAKLLYGQFAYEGAGRSDAGDYSERPSSL